MSKVISYVDADNHGGAGELAARTSLLSWDYERIGLIGAPDVDHRRSSIA
jgi:hypothetical protein